MEPKGVHTGIIMCLHTGSGVSQSEKRQNVRQKKRNRGVAVRLTVRSRLRLCKVKPRNGWNP